MTGLMKALVLFTCLLVILSGCIVVGNSEMTPTTPTQKKSPGGLHKQSFQTPTLPATPTGRVDVNVLKLEQLVHERVNLERERRDVGPLSYHRGLASIGRYHSWDMAQRNYFAHVSPNGVTHQEFRKRYNSNCEITGQNLYRIRLSGQQVFINRTLSDLPSLAKEIVQGWLDSPGHRENLLSPYYQTEGIGIFVTKKGTIYVTQEFCG